MSKEKRRVPKLRFPGFTEDWEQCKFKDIVFKRGKISEADLPYVEFEDINSGIGTLNKNISQKGGHKKGILFETGDVLFGKLRPYLQNWLLCQFTGIAVGDFWVLQPQNVSPAFLYYLIQSEAFQSVANISSGTKMPRSSWSLVSETQFSIPKYNEANMIGEFFSSIDKNITLHQRKLEHLNLKKKALLQKLFPKNGERYPELRFPGFTDAWEQRKLDDIAKIKTGGGTPKTANSEYWSGNIPWIQSSDLVEGDIVRVNINKFINNNALKNSAAKLISRDSIALVTRVGVGKVAVINQDFTTSQDFLSLSDFDGNDIKFLAYQLYRLMQENAKVLQGTSIKGITKIELIEQSISIPSSGQEQNLIANVLSKIDSIITLHQRKLDHLQLQKKALLQQMFV